MLEEIFRKYKIIPDEIYEKIINSEYIFFIDDDTILNKLFEHLYVPINLYEKIPKTDFLYDIASFLSKNNYLTDNLQNQCEFHIHKYTGFNDFYRPLGEDSRYTSNNEGADNTENEITHDFKKLEVIDIYELPFDNGQEAKITIHPYSQNNIVAEIKQHFYKIHKPVKFEIPIESQEIKIKYKRTKYKGFLTLIS